MRLREKRPHSTCIISHAITSRKVVCKFRSRLSQQPQPAKSNDSSSSSSSSSSSPSSSSFSSASCLLLLFLLPKIKEGNALFSYPPVSLCLSA